MTGSQRALFTFALLVFALASFYTSLAMLTRVTPWLFPGKDITDIPGIGSGLDITRSVVQIQKPGADDLVNKRINLLIMGTDQRPIPGIEKLPDDQRYLGTHTDTLMVATIDPLSKTISFLGFPRDMVIDIHPASGRTYEDRINASFGVGLAQGHTVDAAAGQLEKDIKANFGIDVNNYVLLDFKGVEKLVDAIDGVDVDISGDLAVYSWFYSDDDQTGRYVNFPPGKQHLNGYNAVAFGRNRDPSDTSRILRQQLVLQAAISKAFGLGLLNPTAWPDLWDAYASTLRTDIPKSKMFGYMPLLKDTNGRSSTYSLGEPVNGTPTVWGGMLGDASVLFWNPENVQYILNQAFTKAAYGASVVEIQNAYGDGGVTQATGLGRYFVYAKGLPTVNYGPDRPVQPQTTVILYSESKRTVAEDIAKWLNIPPTAIEVETQEGSSNAPDVVVVIGANYHLPGSGAGT